MNFIDSFFKFSWKGIFDHQKRLILPNDITGEVLEKKHLFMQLKVMLLTHKKNERTKRY